VWGGGHDPPAPMGAPPLATGRQTCQIFGFWPLSEVHALQRVPF